MVKFQEVKTYLRKSDYTINILDAIRQGYTPCSRCNPPIPDSSAVYSKSTNSPTIANTTDTTTTSVTTNAAYVGYYSAYTAEYNRRLISNEFDDSIFQSAQNANTLESFTQDEQILYTTLSADDQYDFMIYKFLSLYDSYVALLNSMSPVFDANYYYIYNTDVSSSIGYDKLELLNHFTTQGMLEGRQGCATFNVQSYIVNNPDLVPLYGDNLAQYYLHYINYGQNENRKVF